jgi:hypothetical protein
MTLTRTREVGVAAPDGAATRTASVDHVLCSLPRRAMLNHAEVETAVTETLVAIAGTDAARRASELFDDALARFEGAPLVDRATVTNALLDVRLLVSR